MTTGPLRRSPLLGVRLRDAVTLAQVSDGLELWLERDTTPDRRWRPICGPSGAFAWHDLPGFSTSPEAPPPPRAGWRLKVAAPRGRSLGYARADTLPHAALLDPPAAAAGGATGWLPLYPAASAEDPVAFATVRASLRVRATGAPAAWARLEVKKGSAVLGAAYADEDGEVAVRFPWPEPAPGPGGRPVPLEKQTWKLRPAVAWGALDRPDLDAMVSQPAARLQRRATGATLTDFTAAYGRTTVLRATDGDGQPLSHVFVSPAS